MFQYRLAKELGIAKPSRLADSLTDEEWTTWKALALMDGWYMGWSQTAEVVASIHNAANRIVLSNSAEPQKTASKLEYLSGHEIAKTMTEPTERKGVTAQQAEKILEARYGN